MLKSVTNGDGFRVWRQQLTEELQPATRPRALALAQALVRFPPLKDGGSVLEYTLLYERLIAEYEKVSATKYPDDLRISTLLNGLPADIKRYLQLQIDDSTTYDGLLTKLLQFERTSTNWSTVFKAIGIDKRASNYLAGDGVVPMDVDRVLEDKGKGRWRGGGKDAWGKKGKGKGKNEKGFTKGGGKGKTSRGKDSWGKDSYGKKGGKGKTKDNKGKGKGSSWSHQGAQSDGRKKGPCYVCGRVGHVAAECRERRTNQVHADDDGTSTTTRASAALSSATTQRSDSIRPSASASQVRVNCLELLTDRLLETSEEVWFDRRRMEDVCEGEFLEEDWGDWDEWLEDLGARSYICRVSEGEETDEPELPSTSVQMFSLQDAESDYEIFDYAGEAGDVCDEFESCGLGDLAVRAVRSSLSSIIQRLMK